MQDNELVRVSCPSSIDWWGVGYAATTLSGELTLIEHWDGSAWTIVSSPSPSSTRYNVLLGVSCVTGTDLQGFGV